MPQIQQQNCNQNLILDNKPSKYSRANKHKYSKKNQMNIYCHESKKYIKEYYGLPLTQYTASLIQKYEQQAKKFNFKKIKANKKMYQYVPDPYQKTQRVYKGICQYKDSRLHIISKS